MIRAGVFIINFFYCLTSAAQQPALSSSWQPVVKDGLYRNPILHADYSDPDAIRVGDNYYMTSSSFNHVPGLPLLHSRDLVHWKLIGHALPRLVPEEHFRTVRHGGGVWAPSIRYHGGEFYIFYPDPDFGIYMIKAAAISGPWSDPVLVMAGKGLIDPCPLWDDDGKAWLVHAFAGSRAGIKSVLAVCPMAADGTKTIGQSRIVYDGHGIDPTVEGPKFYKRNGWYYIFAPAGGVSTGWQIVLRSRQIFGPYERKMVMSQGTSKINGPHQGAWVDTPGGESWFLHFQDLEAYGRIVHLQPMRWKNDWPIIGADKDGDSVGEPVLNHELPLVTDQGPPVTPPESDEFDSGAHPFGPQWQWQANPAAHWAFSFNNHLRLYAQTWPDSNRNLWMAPHLLMQKLPSLSFTATCFLKFHPAADSDKAGLILFGSRYGYVAIEKAKVGYQLVRGFCANAERGETEQKAVIRMLKSSEIWLRLTVNEGMVQFYYSENGQQYQAAGQPFEAAAGKWVGAKMGLFCNQEKKSNDAGFADFDWFRVEASGSESTVR
jgi:beta-xylosidase